MTAKLRLVTTDTGSLITETASENKRGRGRPRLAVADTREAQHEIETVNDYGRKYFMCDAEPMTRRQELTVGYAARAYDALAMPDDPDKMDNRVYDHNVMTQAVLAELGRMKDTETIRTAAARLLTTRLRRKGDAVPLLRQWRLGTASPREGDLYRALATAINRHMWRYPVTTFDDVRATIYDIERAVTHAEGDSARAAREGHQWREKER